jgi:DNA-binding SARP family transcriptional activator
LTARERKAALFLEGKFSCPLAGTDRYFGNLFKSIESIPLVQIESPSGYLLAESLVAGLQNRGCPIVWVSFTKLDADPATCLLSLLEAFQTISLEASDEILTLLPAFFHVERKWVHIYRAFAEEIAGNIRSPMILVLDRVEFLTTSPETLIALLHHFLPGLGKQIQVILVSQQKIPLRIDHNLLKITAENLYLPESFCMQQFDQAGVQLSTSCFRTFLSLIDGNAEALVGLCAIGKSLGGPYLENLVHHSRNTKELLDQAARSVLLDLPEADFTNVALLVSVGFSHAMLNEAITGRALPADFPLGEALQNGWVRPYSLWHAQLKRAIASQAASMYARLQSAAEYLCENGALLEGLDLFQEIRATATLAEYLEQYSPELLRYGQWQYLICMIEDLPPELFQAHPSLMYISGEFCLFTGKLDRAYQFFQQDIEYSVRLGDSAGACTGLLAIATLADYQGDLKAALASALRARDLANSSGLSWQLGWVEYQLGCLFLHRSRAQEARDCFTRAADLAVALGDSLMQNTIASIAPLAVDQQRIQQQRVQKHQAYQDIRRVERDQAGRIRVILDSRMVQPQNLASIPNWLEVPLILKLSRQEYLRNPPGEVSGYQKIIKKLQRFWRRIVGSQDIVPILKSWAGRNPSALRMTPPEVLAETDRPSFSESTHTVSESDPVFHAPISPNHVTDPSPEPLLPVTGSESKSVTITVYFLGAFRIGVDDLLLENVPGGLVGSLLKYLLYHRSRRIPREELIDVFWPDTDPELARNRLNVALSSVRQVFRDVLDLDVILYQQGMYTLNPQLDVWVDLNEFESQLDKAFDYDRRKQHGAAVNALEIAANLYQGDFLAGDPYDEWTVFTRERVRLAYLDALVQLAHQYFESSQYAACAAICQSILERDICREDVHCLLMRCYARQDQFHLGLRQYQTCVEALNRELDIDPAEATQALYHRLQRREHTQPGLA